MSYILKSHATINGSEEILYFQGWAGKKSKHAQFSNKIRFAKHWKDKTNCKRFHNRNQDALSRYNLEVERVIVQRTCEQCGAVIDKESRTDSRFCSEACRNRNFKQKSKNTEE